MSGIYKCKLRRRVPRPQSPAPSKEVIETEPIKAPLSATKEESVQITKELDSVNENLNMKLVEVPVQRSIKQEPSKHSMFHVFRGEQAKYIAKRNIHINPLLRRRI